MRYFYKVASGVEVRPLMLALMAREHLWNQQTFRTTFPNTPHAAVDDIWLRFSDPAKCDTTTHVIGDDRPIWFQGAIDLPQVQPIVLDLMKLVGAYELGRLLITRLRPGGRILRHADRDGSYVQTADRARYHVVLNGAPGSLYNVADETVQMLTGEVWWFNAHEEHEVVNNSADDRIHLLVDVRTWPTALPEVQ